MGSSARHIGKPASHHLLTSWGLSKEGKREKSQVRQSLTVREVQTLPCRAQDVGSVGLRESVGSAERNQPGGQERCSLERCVPKNSRVREVPKGVLRVCAQLTRKECKKSTGKRGMVSKEPARAPVQCQEEDKELS